MGRDHPRAAGPVRLTAPAEASGGDIVSGRIRRRALVALGVTVPAGLFAKLGSTPAWVADGVAGALYVLFWILVALVLLPRRRPGELAAVALVMTAALEVLQLWHPAWLEALREPFLGRTLLGTTFALADFFFYLLGAGAGWVLARRIRCS